MLLCGTSPMNLGDASVPGKLFTPFQGIAMMELWDTKLSQDHIFLNREEVMSWLLKFQMCTFESSLAETMCFPSVVKDADVWFPPFRRPLYLQTISPPEITRTAESADVTITLLGLLGEN